MSDISKLPKWAQEKIRDLERQRQAAVEALKDFTDHHDTGPVLCRMLVCDGESRGASTHAVRFKAHWIEIDHAGVHLDITLAGNEIRLSYCAEGRASGPVYLKPTSFQQFTLKPTLEL